MDIDFLSLNKRYNKKSVFLLLHFQEKPYKTSDNTQAPTQPHPQGTFPWLLDPTSKASEKHPGDEVGTNPRSLLPERLVAFAHSHNTGAVSAHPLLIRMAQQSDPKSGAFNCRGELKAPH